jgi:dTDP-4-dehydrorhamnose 3,5-epimerase
MRFSECSLAGVFRVEPEPHIDARGSFARLHCEREFGQRGLTARMVQTSLSRSKAEGTVRGMHFQWPPARESKLVRCLRGRIFDAVIDLRPASATFGRHFSMELSASEQTALFIPPGLAHGFQTLEDECEVLYQMTDYYTPELSGGVRWDDAAFGIAWPLPCSALHERDAAFLDFNAARFAHEVAERGGWTGSS